MKKWFKAAFSILMCAAMVLGGVSCSNKNHGSTTTQTTSTSTNASTSEDLQTANTIAGKFTDRIISDGDAAILAVKDAAQRLGVSSATDGLTVKSVNTVEDVNYYRLQHHYKGIPVYGGDFVVVSDQTGQALGIASNTCDIDENISLTPTAHIDAIGQSISEVLNVPVVYSQPSEQDLVIYYDELREQHVLAYSMHAFSRNEQFSLIVDAIDGEVLQSYALTFTFSADIPSVDEMLDERVDVYDAESNLFCAYLITLGGVTYYFDGENLYDATGVRRYTFRSATFYDLNGRKVNESAEVKGTLYLLKQLPDGRVQYVPITSMSEQSVKNDERANALVWNIAKSHAFFETVFGRKGYDNKDGDVIAVVDDFLAIEGSAYSKSWGDKTIIGFSPNQEITVCGVAHEYMHSVEQKISGMQYAGESGAIMEGYSDIFGELVEDWFLDGLDGDCDWQNFNRDMSNPLANRNPSRYGSTYWESPKELRNDNGWVHNNSTVISHAAYLMTQDGENGDALSMQQLAKLWYNALFLLPNNCTFKTLRERIELTAARLDLTQTQQMRVYEVFNEIGVESSYECINVNSTLFVFGADHQVYSGYSVTVQEYDDAWFGEDQFVDYTQFTVNGSTASLSLPKGKYRLIITNQAEPTQVAVKHIETRKNHSSDSLVIFTSFTAHTHRFGAWETVKDATLEETGLRERVCGCGEKETEIIPILSDLVVNGVKLALRADRQSYIVVGVTGMHAQIDIPAAYEGLPVVEIGEYGLANHWYMESVYIPSSIRAISETAFVGSKALSNITVAADHPDFTSSGGHLYSKDGKTLLAYAVGQWNTAFEVPDGVTTIARYTFYSSSLSELFIPETVTVIEGYALEGCDALTVYCAASEKPSGWDENWNKISAQSDTVCRVVWGYVAQEATGSQGLEFWLGEDDTYIVGGIGECTDTHVVIPSTYNGKPVTAFGEDIYWGETMTSIEIPEGIVYMGSAPFLGNDSLTNIIVAESNPYYASVDGNLYNKAKTQLLRYATGKAATEFTVPSSVTSIGTYAVYGAQNLTSVTVSGNVTEIGSHAFSDCDNLKRVYMGDGIKSIGAFAFAMCESLESVRFGNGLERIQNEAFYACNTLADISLPDTLTSIGASAFADTAYYKTASNWENGVLYIGEYLIASQSGAMPSSAYTVKTGTVGIAAGAFLHKNYRLTSVTMPDTVKWIGSGAFSYCYGLSSISLSACLVTIDDQAFYQCKALTSVTIGDSVKRIGAKAFYYCQTLTRVTIGKSVEYIGEKAFGYCEKLESIEVAQENAHYYSLDGNLYSIADAALLQYATAKTARTFIVPDGIRRIGAGAFAYCATLRTVVLPDSLTVIENDAFYKCTSLMNVYYCGTAEEWSQISIGSQNSNLTNATKYYNYTVTQ